MTSPFIQVPPIGHPATTQGPGLDQSGGMDQLPALAKLLMAKGQLALEQEKFQNEVMMQKQKKQQLDQLGQTLGTLFQGAGTPEGLQGALQGSVGPLAAAGESVAPVINQLPQVQQQVHLSNQQHATARVYAELEGQDLRDPRVQAEALFHLGKVNPAAAKDFAESVRNLGGQFSFHQDGLGQWWIGDNKTGQIHKGPLGAPKGTAANLRTKEGMAAAATVYQALTDIEHLLKSHPDGDIYTTKAAAAEGIGKVPWMRGAMGVAGQLGVGPGTPEALAVQNLSPAQNQFQRLINGAAHAYPALIGVTGNRSVWLYNSIRDFIRPKAGETAPEIRTDAARLRANLREKMAKIIRGEAIDMQELPFFDETVKEPQMLGEQPQASSDMGAQTPMSFEDLLQVTPK